MQPMLESGSQRRHDAFISYSRKNEAFAAALEKALEGYTPPKGLAAPRRHLDVFRDKQDFTGTEYHRSLEQHLKYSAKLIVICSPEAYRSEYVNDEIRQFARLRGSADIIPVLLAGIPNNEAGLPQDSRCAFPPALCEVMPMPLAADFRGLIPGRRMNGKVYRDAWYTTLANIYDVPRAEIEQRDRKRRVRRRTVAAGITIIVMCLILSASIVAWRSRQQADARARDARQLRYIGNIELAQQAYEATDLPGMRTRLEAARPGSTNALEDLRGFEWHYLWRLSQGPTTAVATEATPKALAWSPDGTFFAIGATDGTVTLWSAASAREIGRLERQGSAITGIAFSSDGKTLAIADAQSPVALWDVSTRHKMFEINELGQDVAAVSFSPVGPALASVTFENGKKTVRIWDAVSRHISTIIEGDGTASGSNLFAAYSPDGAMLAISSGFGVRLCRLPSGEKMAEFDGPGRYVSAIAFSADGQTLAAGSDDGSLVFFDTASRRKFATVQAHDDYISSLAFSRNGRLLVTASADKTVKLWDARSHAARSTWKGHTDAVEAVAISPDGTTVVSAGDDKTLRVWNTSAHSEYDELTDLDVLFGAMAPSPRDNRLTVATGSTLVVWDPTSRRESARLAGHREPVARLAFSPDQRTVAIASNGAVELWDITSGNIDSLRGHQGQVYAVAFSPDGKTLASAGHDRTIRLWDVTARQPASAPRTGHVGAVTAVAFSPDATMLASGGSDRTVRLWDTVSRRELASVPACSGTVPPNQDETQPLLTALNFSPDGKTLAAAGADGLVSLWRVDRGNLQSIGTLAGHTGVVNDVAFSPDGRTIATASADKTVKLWQARLFRELLTIREPNPGRADAPHFIAGSENQVAAVAFSHDGRFLVSGLLDGTIRIRAAPR